jgi:hypothetical protein
MNKYWAFGEAGSQYEKYWTIGVQADPRNPLLQFVDGGIFKIKPHGIENEPHHDKISSVEVKVLQEGEFHPVIVSGNGVFMTKALARLCQREFPGSLRLIDVKSDSQLSSYHLIEFCNVIDCLNQEEMDWADHGGVKDCIPVSLPVLKNMNFPSGVFLSDKCHFMFVDDRLRNWLVDRGMPEDHFYEVDRI